MCKAKYCDELAIETLKAKPIEVAEQLKYGGLSLFELDNLITDTLRSIIREGVIDNISRVGSNQPTIGIDTCLEYLKVFKEKVDDIKCDYDTETIEVKSRLTSRIEDITNILNSIKNS